MIDARKALIANSKAIRVGQELPIDFDPDWLTMVSARILPDGRRFDVHTEPPIGKRTDWFMWFDGDTITAMVRGQNVRVGNLDGKDGFLLESGNCQLIGLDGGFAFEIYLD